MTIESHYKLFWTSVQKQLKELGYWHKPIDGKWTNDVEESLMRLKEDNGMRHDRSLIGPLTLAILARRTPAKKPVSTLQTMPAYIWVARDLIGEKEIKGPRHNPAITQFWETIGATWFNDDETPYCGGFVGHCLIRGGLPSLSASLAPRARAWEKYGVGLTEPHLWCIVTFYRGSRSSGNGHVGFVAGRAKDGRLMVLGANQRDSINIAPFDTARVTSYRQPASVPVNKDPLPLYNADGTPSSENEA